MKNGRIITAVAGAMVAGVVLGSVVSGFAASSGSTSTTGSVVAACGAAGLRLGATMRESGGRLLDVVAKLTGQTTDEVAAERQAGKTFTQIAADKNVSSASVVDEAMKVRATVLDAKVKSGDITQEQADAALANMKTRLADRVNSVNTGCNGAGGGGGMGGGRGAGGGCGGGGCGVSQ